MRKYLKYAPVAAVAILSAHPAFASGGGLTTPDIGDSGYDMDVVTDTAKDVGKVVTAAVLTVGSVTIAPRIARMAVRWVKGGIS